MKLSAVKQSLFAQGILDDRMLMSYATLSATLSGEAFQNITAICFQKDGLAVYRANLDNSVGDLLARCPYSEITGFSMHSRPLYSSTAFACGDNKFRFWSYDKKVFQQAFRGAGLLN